MDKIIKEKDIIKKGENMEKYCTANKNTYVWSNTEGPKREMIGPF